MNKILCFVLLLTAAAAGSSSAQTPAATLPATEPEHTPADPGRDHGNEKLADAKRAEAEKAVIELEQRWCDAEATHDAAFLEKVEADTYVYTDSVGHMTTKGDDIAAAKQGGDKITYKLSDMKAQVYGDTVVLTGRTSFEGVDSDAASDAYRWTDVFVRRASGEWQVVASHASALERKQPDQLDRNEL